MDQEGPPLLFSEEELVPWIAEWQDMPEYEVENLEARFQLIVNFNCAADLEDFGKALGQNIRAGNSRQMKSIWFPEQEIGRYKNKRYIHI